MMRVCDNGVMRDATPEELAQAKIDADYFKQYGLAFEKRNQRNQLLGASDWTQLMDVPASTRAKWSAYRQALRDVPQQAGFPESVVWPALPV